MEERKKKSITSVFFKYVCFYTGGALFWLFALFLIYFLLYVTGEVLPANHMEALLNASADDIQKAAKITDEVIPKGCTYGVYEYDGTWLYGTFTSEEMDEGWEHYELNSIYARGKGYYRFFMRGTKEICIVKYEIAAQFRNEFLRTYFPKPDILMVLAFVILFITHTFFVSRCFGKYMRKRLRVLNEVTRKIKNQDLEFQEEHLELKEVDEVLSSLYQMKEALKDSLYRQWNLEKNRDEQITALAHDIRTPLTIIRGNAELLDEGELAEDERRYNQDILQSVTAIEEYLMILNEILLPKRENDGKRDDDIKKISCNAFADRLAEQARTLASARQYSVVCHRSDLYGEILCNEHQLFRAWNNILGNAMDYSPKDGGIQVYLEMEQKNEEGYLKATVTDEGPGFSDRDLKHAADQFYQGDQGRSSKAHHGIGLYTAERFVQAQGGYLRIANARPHGARVSIYIRIITKRGCR